jgi:hypothetical protein
LSTDSTTHRTRFTSFVRALEELGKQEFSHHISVISMSQRPNELSDLANSVARLGLGISSSPDDAHDPAFTQRLVRHPSKLYIKGNIDQITTHQLVEGKLPGFFESPVPRAFSEVNAHSHRWLVEVSFAGNQPPRHPSMGEKLASGPNLGTARAGIDGLVYQCPGSLVRGQDIELQMLRIDVFVPDSDFIFRTVLASAGYQMTISDKGAYGSEAVRKFGGLEEIGSALHDSKTAELLNKYLSTEGSKKGVFDNGVFLRDHRRYLNFISIQKILEDRDIAASLIDQWISKDILRRGFIFKCVRCSNAAWFSVDSVTQRFICPRCGSNQQYTRAHWLHPEEPSWFYKLDEIVYQMLSHNGEVTLLTLLTLRKQSRDSFLYSPELSIRLDSNPKAKMEIDICCIVDGKLIIGEAKSVGSLASNKGTAPQIIERYRKVADLISASGLIFSTTATEWDEGTRQAIDELRKNFPLLHLYNYRSENLGA